MKLQLLYDFRGMLAGELVEVEPDESGELLDTGFLEVVEEVEESQPEKVVKHQKRG